jgi:uncharacterized membrane protein YphA (DoxX/SURF4 family)
MKSTQDVFLLIGRVVLGLAFVAEGLRQIEVWRDVVGLFRHAGAPYPFEFGVATVAANLVAPMLFIIGIRARVAALVLAVVTGAGLYLLHRVDLGAPEFQRSVAIIGALLLVSGAGPGRYALEPS